MRFALLMMGLVAALVAVGATLLAPYGKDGQAVPTGTDTPFYIWRDKVVVADGLDALPGTVPPPLRVQAYRVGHSLLATYVDAIAGIDPYRWAFALPAVMAVIVALGAGSLAIRGLREEMWTIPVYAIAVGASINVVQIAGNRSDDVIVIALGIAAVSLAVGAAAGLGGQAAAALLIAAAAVTEWVMALFMLAVIGAAAALVFAKSIAARRRGRRSPTAPAWRLAVVIVTAIAASAAALALAPAVPELPRGGGETVIGHLRRLGPPYAALGPFAALGAMTLVWRRDPRRTTGLLLALAWAAVGLAALVAYLPSGAVTLPVHRVLTLALGIPVLAAAGLVAGVELLASIPPRVLGVALGAALAVPVLIGQLVWNSGQGPPTPLDQAAIMTQSATAADYVARVGGGSPIVFVAHKSDRYDPARVIRASLPSDQILRMRLYLGTVGNLLAGRPTRLPGQPYFDRLAVASWRAVQPVMGQHPIVIALSAMSRGIDLAAWREAAPGVHVVRGPTPRTSISAAHLAAPSVTSLAWMLTVSLGLFGLAGLGWSFALVSGGVVERIMLAPAVGMAVLILGGLVAFRLGVGGPGPRPLLLAAVAVAGWVICLLKLERVRPATRSGDGEPNNARGEHLDEGRSDAAGHRDNGAT